MEEIWFEEFLLPSLGSIPLTIQEQMRFEEIQNGYCGGHLGYWNVTILAILNLHVAQMPPIKFQLNPTYHSGGDVENAKILRMDGQMMDDGQ